MSSSAVDSLERNRSGLFINYRAIDCDQIMSFLHQGGNFQCNTLTHVAIETQTLYCSRRQISCLSENEIKTKWNFCNDVVLTERPAHSSVLQRLACRTHVSGSNCMSPL